MLKFAQIEQRYTFRDEMLKEMCSRVPQYVVHIQKLSHFIPDSNAMLGGYVRSIWSTKLKKKKKKLPNFVPYITLGSNPASRLG